MWVDKRIFSFKRAQNFSAENTARKATELNPLLVLSIVPLPRSLRSPFAAFAPLGVHNRRADSTTTRQRRRGGDDATTTRRRRRAAAPDALTVAAAPQPLTVAAGPQAPSQSLQPPDPRPHGRCSPPSPHSRRPRSAGCSSSLLIQDNG